jgi:hypothetical protein
MDHDRPLTGLPRQAGRLAIAGFRSRIDEA